MCDRVEEELEITRLLGATNFFIKSPLYIEGLLQGLAGSTLSIVMLYGIFSLFVMNISSPLQGNLISGDFQLLFLSPSSAIEINNTLDAAPPSSPGRSIIT